MSFLTFATLLSALALNWVQAPNHYCDICEFHTMCGTTVPGTSCVDHESKAPNGEEKAHILRIHNIFRNKVARGQEKRGNPGAQFGSRNMMRMEWDDELARIAQRAADQCYFGHDCGACRKVLNDRFSVGQNVAVKRTSTVPTEVDFKKLISNLYLKEVVDFPKRTVFSYQSGGYGHYSQIVWWNSRLIGCGASFYTEGLLYTQLLVCNYGPLGNVAGRKMYRTGFIRKGCPKGSVKKKHTYKGLCTLRHRNRLTFHTDSVTENVMPTCEEKGFRLPSGMK